MLNAKGCHTAQLNTPRVLRSRLQANIERYVLPLLVRGRIRLPGQEPRIQTAFQMSHGSGGKEGWPTAWGLPEGGDWLPTWGTRLAGMGSTPKEE